ncbi:hybrid-cluster NAD(P)-dependent oxidoreductase [Vibrio intestinalis]|uniref:hybrid-cluster NAD(P)-dependent oxidoreductase n=1 Tax=Vibrio intestinalis TaxID=2933291 RepID=UPI0021A529E7|nr:hybrid-cluster NAD(P)-dependent oxidoreductase [Vibrio intestinalis]
MKFEWPQGLPATLTCIDKIQETADCFSIKLSANSGERFDFKPGQFVSLGFEINGKVEYRAYSISSLPEQDYLQLTIKRVDSGKVSNYILDKLSIGDTVLCLAPTGNFNCIDHPARNDKALLLSAGCGITPVYAMAKHWLAQQVNIDIAFVHIARSASETIYLEELAQLDSQHANFHLNLLLKDATDTPYHQGRFDADWLVNLAADYQQRTVYLCGPEQFMRDSKGYLEALQFDMNEFYQESFTPIAEANQNQEHVQNDQATVTVESFGKTFQAQHGATLADSLEAEQLPIIIACRSGICGSCKCKVTDGSVKSLSVGPLSAEEVEQGYVLACSSTIEGDLALELS